MKAHLLRIWPGTSALIPLPLLAWPLYCTLTGHARPEHWLISAIILSLAYVDGRTKRLFLGLYPIGLVASLYDAMRFVKDVGLSPERIHVCDLRALESIFFGYREGGVAKTLHDWFQPRAVPAVDLFAAIPYGTFIYAAIGCAVFLYFKDYRRFVAFTWTFFLLNVAGFVTYHLVPAAPPWYFHEHGCHVDMSALPSEGPNLARVDRLLGFPYFHGFYARASSVFGAVPSLHCAYPVAMSLAAVPVVSRPAKVFLVGYAGSMIFAAVYLDHHWLIDAVVGVAYAIALWLVVRAIQRRKTSSLQVAPASDANPVKDTVIA